MVLIFKKINNLKLIYKNNGKNCQCQEKKSWFTQRSKEKILEDNITNAMEEGFSNLSDIMRQGFSFLSEIMKQGFSDLLNAINNHNSSRTNFVKDKNENPNTHSLGKSLTVSSKKIQIPTRPQIVIPTI